MSSGAALAAASTLLFQLYPAHRHLHSFPTRRSSDLVFTSNAPVGSSHSNISGRLAIARAIATRCCSPPDNCRSEEHTSELQSHSDLVCRLLLEKKKKTQQVVARPRSVVEHVPRARHT